jgi:hypothetical protein
MNTQILAIVAIAAVVGLIFAATIVQAVDAKRQDRLQIARSGPGGQVQNIEKQSQGDNNFVIIRAEQNKP